MNGYQVWLVEWERVPEQSAEIRDPAHGKPFRFPVYRARLGAWAVTFAAGEFSAGVWGFFVPCTLQAAV